MEWGRYFLTGDFAESRIGRNLSEHEISYINRFLDHGMSLTPMISKSQFKTFMIKVMFLLVEMFWLGS